MNFEDTDFRQEILDLENPYDVKLVSDFLERMGFAFEPSEVECTMIVYNLNGELIGTGSHQESILKYVVVAPEFRETTAFALIVTSLTEKLLKKHKHSFVFTRPENSIAFQGLGYTEIATAKPLFTVLEFGFESIKTYQEYLQEQKVQCQSGKIAGIVINCNPFTKGHLHLIEKAASENDLVYLFVVEANLSVFPFETRWDLIKQGVKHLSNVHLLSGGKYMVSGAIFPSYFLKNETIGDVQEKQAELDVRIFAEYIAPILEIKKRYVGTENYCATTAAYNKAMKSILPEYDVELVEIKRKSSGFDQNDQPNCISASKVRQAIKDDALDIIIDFLPEVTRDYLLSEASVYIRQKIKEGTGRH
jgi:[citrate (pro-3S)-lyase] ligase